MQEFADFLGGQPPLDALDAEDMARLEVEYFAAWAVVVEGEDRLRHLWVVRTGRWRYSTAGRSWTRSRWATPSGASGCLSDLPPRLTVRAHEDSLCLRIPDPRTFLTHPQRLRFAAVHAVSRPGRLTSGVRRSGEHRGQLDLKSGGLVPVVALARWIAIVSGDARGTTTDRLRRGAQLGLLSTDEADTLAGGFDDVYTLLLRHEVQAIRGGSTPTTYFAPAAIDTLTRRHLRETFRAIAMVQARSRPLTLRPLCAISRHHRR